MRYLYCAIKCKWWELYISMRKKQKYRQYFTPKNIAELLVKYIPQSNIKSVIDLAVGDGELLRAASKKFKDAILYGADIDKEIIDNFKKNALSEHINLWTGDSLDKRMNQWKEYKHIIENNKFDLIIGNPPFNHFEKKELNNSEKKYSIEIRFLLKALEIVKEQGYVAMILPNGVLTNPNSNIIREMILRETTIKYVIQLYKKSFQKVNADISMIIMKKKKGKYIQKRINIRKIDRDFQEECVIIKGKNGIDRLDYDYHNYKIEIKESMSKLEFELVKLRDVVGSCKRGTTMTNKMDCICDKGIPFIHTTNVENILIDKKKFTYINIDYEEKFKSYKAEINDILIGRVGSSCIRKIGIVSNYNEIGVISDCLFILRDVAINPYYLALFLKSSLGYKQLVAIKRGSCSKFITKDDLLEIYIPVIHEEMQLEIEKNVKHIMSLNENLEVFNNHILKEIEKLERILKGGENDVSI